MVFQDGYLFCILVQSNMVHHTLFKFTSQLLSWFKPGCVGLTKPGFEAADAKTWLGSTLQFYFLFFIFVLKIKEF